MAVHQKHAQQDNAHEFLSVLGLSLIHIFITLGQNIGTCVTALLSSLGANRTAKRAAVIHLLFNVVGAVVFGIGMFVIFSFNGNWADSQVNSVGISVFHTAVSYTHL